MGENGTSGPRPPFNPMFERIALDENQHALVGLVAYGLYKKAKREWAIQFWERHGRAPTEAERDAYTHTWTETRVEGVHEQAAGTLAAFASSVVEQQKPAIVTEALRGSFVKSVLSSVVGAFIYTLLLVMVAVILANAGVDLLGIFQNVARSSG